MNNEHGAFFDMDYLLASCLLESEQKEAVAKTVKVVDYANLLKETNAPEAANATLGEATFDREEEERVDQMVLKKERIDVPDGNLQCGGCGTQFGTQEGFIQHSRKGCKKEEPKKKSKECDQCGKCYTSKQSLRAHKEKQHNMDNNIKQERYDDPSMDPSHLYQRFPEESEMVTNNEDIGYGVGDFQGNTSGMQIDDGPTNEVFESNTPPVEQELDQLLSEVRKRNEDVLQDFADESINNEEHSKAETSDGDRFVCEVEGCGKSYTIKSNMKIHMKKAHNIVSTRAKNKKPKVSMEPPQDIDIEGQEKESNLRWDELEKIRAQYYNNTAEASPMSVDGGNFEDGFQPKVDEIQATFSTDISTDLDDDKDVEQTINQGINLTSETNEEQTPSLVAGLDMSQSKYFTRNPKVITSARGKSLSLFNELPVGLSEDWKMRTFEVTTKTGDKSMIKHYLTPELKVLKTGLAVVEYLRLKGEMGTEQLLEVSRMLNIPEKKLKTLYD